MVSKATYYNNFLNCRHSAYPGCGTTSEILILAKAMCGEHDYLLFKRENRPGFPRLWQLQDMKLILMKTLKKFTAYPFSCQLYSCNLIIEKSSTIVQ
jgi:hypothetical protein